MDLLDLAPWNVNICNLITEGDISRVLWQTFSVCDASKWGMKGLKGFLMVWF